MTPEYVSLRWLSLRCWALRTVLPASVALLITLLVLRSTGVAERTLDHTAVMVGFAALYFILFRGGHILMIRSLHFDLLRRHPEEYREKLLLTPANSMRRANLGFALARMKRDIMMDARKPHPGFKRK